LGLAGIETLAVLIVLHMQLSTARDDELWLALQNTRLRLASQVEFSEQIQRGQAWVVIHDPVRNLFYKTTPEVQKLLISLDGERTLAQILAQQPELAQLMRERSPAMRTIAQLLEAGLLQGDFNYDYGEDIAKHREKKRALGRMRWQRPWMLKLPLFNPDTQLTWLYQKTRFIWSRAGFVVWGITVLIAAILLVDYFPHLQQFWSARFLDPLNLALLIVVYPCLKALHELAHGLTTKKWGGQVYEVGVMLLVFMPVPYVDASASTRFSDKKQRMLVAASGVMTELFCAAVAFFVWLGSDTLWVRDICMNIMIIGAVSSLLFNGNPLLRFDGYYVLSDWLEIPNLGTRASVYLKTLWQKKLLGVEVDSFPLAAGEKKWLLTYGVLSGVYRLVLGIGIAIYIAGHYFFVGVLLGIWSLLLQLILPLKKGLTATFSIAKQQRKLPRFWLGHALLGLVVYLLLFVVPVRHATDAQGIISVAGDHQIKTAADGFIQEILVRSGETVEAGQPLLILENASLPAQLKVIQSRIAEQEVLLSHYLTRDPAQAGFYRDELQHLRQEEADLRDSLANLTVRSAVAGQVEIAEEGNLPGRYLNKGDRVGHVLARGGYSLTAVVPERLGDRLSREVQEIQVRSHSDPHTVLPGRDMRPVPQAGTQLPDPRFGSLYGGSISVDTSDTSGTRALEPFFQVEVQLDLNASDAPLPGRANVLFIHRNEPLGIRLWRELRLLLLDRFQW
jgi:putative peptide zinc metalloprotease protein